MSLNLLEQQGKRRGTEPKPPRCAPPESGGANCSVLLRRRAIPRCRGARRLCGTPQGGGRCAAGDLMMSRLDTSPSRYHKSTARLRPNMEYGNDRARHRCSSENKGWRQYVSTDRG